MKIAQIAYGDQRRADHYRMRLEDLHNLMLIVMLFAATMVSLA